MSKPDGVWPREGRDRIVTAIIDETIERCAQVAENFVSKQFGWPPSFRKEIAAAIRAQKEKP